MSIVAARRWALLFLASIFVGTLMPAVMRDAIFGSIPYGGIVQKIGHLIAFAGSAFLLMRAAFWRVRRWHVFAIGMLLAIGTEGLQMIVGGRNPSMRDLLLDMLGICIGLVLARSRRS